MTAQQPWDATAEIPLCGQQGIVGSPWRELWVNKYLKCRLALFTSAKAPGGAQHYWIMHHKADAVKSIGIREI